MFHTPSSNPSQQMKYNTMVSKIKLEEKQLHKEFKHDTQLREFNNTRKEHSPGILFRNNFPNVYTPTIKRYL
jgi:hypothetical protein